MLVRWGYAKVSIYDPIDRYEKRLRRAEAKAKAEGRGLWGEC